MMLTTSVIVLALFTTPVLILAFQAHAGLVGVDNS
jgi:hypothetical protein